LLATGEVLMVGGEDRSGTPLDSTELYDARAGRFRAGPRLTARRKDLTVTVLQGGGVLVAGGVASDTAVLRSAELLGGAGE
jgi:Flp pilus assembly secretin CpaC